MDKNLRERAIKLFDEKKHCEKCLCCKSSNLKVLNGFFINIIQEDPRVLDITGSQKEAVPSIVYYCNNCGYIMQYHLGVYLDRI